MADQFEFRPRLEIAPAVWNEFADSSDEAWLWHRTELIDAQTQFPGSRDESFAVVDSRGGIRAIMPLHLRSKRILGIVPHCVLYSAGGLACLGGLSAVARRKTEQAVQQHLLGLMNAYDAARVQARRAALTPSLYGGARLQSSPLLMVGFENTSIGTWVVDLNASQADIRARYIRDSLRQMRKLAETSYSLREASGDEDLRSFYELHLKTYNRSDGMPDPYGYYRLIFERLLPAGLARMLFLERDGRLIAAQLSAFYKRGAIFLSGASADDKIGGENRVLFDNQIMTARDRRCLYYETGEFYNGLDRKEYGISEFKRSFGAELVVWHESTLLGRRKFRVMRALRQLYRAMFDGVVTSPHPQLVYPANRGLDRSNTKAGTFLVITPITRADVVQLAKLSIMTPLSWAAPIDRLLPVARKLRAWGGSPQGEESAAIAAVLSGYVPSTQVDEIRQRWMDRQLEASMQILALLRPFRRWQPVVRWHGLDNIAAVTAKRSGAILWVSEFVYSSLITKMAFAKSGLRFNHLSRPGHGFSFSPFGIRFLNPLWRKVEDRYLAERIIIATNDSGEAVQILRARLAATELVSITVGLEARRTLTTKFLGGMIRVATGPIYLSHSSGAPILPVFTVRAEDGAYDVTVARPLLVEQTGHVDYLSAIQAYASMLEPYVLSYPDQWNGWMHLVAPQESN
jgi:lauroyl/myristoyl acyltransferase